MSTLKTLQLRFVSDPEFPMFRRVHFEEVEVGIADVVLRGIHPWYGDATGYDRHPSLTDKFMKVINDDATKVPELLGHGWCTDVHNSQDIYGHVSRRPRFIGLLTELSRRMYFTENLGYRDLLGIARKHLASNWSKRLAGQLLDRDYPRFNDLRQFLKRKHPKLKLSSYADVHMMPLDRLLCLDDFADREQMLLTEAFPMSNFRHVDFLMQVADGEGRLKLADSHRHFTISVKPMDNPMVSVTWSVTCDTKSDSCRFQPQIGGSLARREAAMDFAKAWRMDDGKLCFSTDMEKVEQMVAMETAKPDFPMVNYFQKSEPIRASADLDAKHGMSLSDVLAYTVGGIPSSTWTASDLKELLRSYGLSTTGNKADLLKRLGQHAAESYTKQKPALDAYFGKHRFIHINDKPRRFCEFSVWERNDPLRNMLLSLYLLRHLRGDTILDITHENDSTTVQQLALALLSNKVQLTGAFLPVI